MRSLLAPAVAGAALRDTRLGAKAIGCRDTRGRSAGPVRDL